MSVIDVQTLNQKAVSKNRLKYMITVTDSSITLTRVGRPYWIIAAAAVSFVLSLFILGIIFLILTAFFIIYYFMQKQIYEFNRLTTEVREVGNKLTFTVQPNRVYTFTELNTGI
ncbi:MAG: hypothetical protein JRN10_01820 [Nitrososphaerota archaeon]|jgi:hypothetical protein|nr:hypothetical protein [Nitrososphaerota archaeon]MDG6926907.1 hypothetical protein [Nitrososphaerota archaeon]MDG6929975.1 hypothetical protein [Nitrososphaerota archaeon]MDG6931926.1 hypothetical protein [Nitrososphaerota archaeon]MDG6943871.1 hypothetical protein [Nitrososphaerota archaeon]